ncbi:MAG: SDR family NAD(P)-dependent oxidoreductase [Halioglobus sp.]
MTGKLSVITGGSSGLGLALGRALAAQGDRVILVARNPLKLEAARDAIARDTACDTIGCAVADVSLADEVQAVMDSIAAEHGGIDQLINSAGIMREGYFESLTDADFHQVLDINLFGTVNCIRAALPHLKRSRGRIVNIASVASLTGVFGYSAYCASKHALKGLSESLYHELGRYGIRVQLICPPEFESPMVDALEQGRSPENAAHSLMIPRQPVEVIVKETLAAMQTDRFQTIPGHAARVMGFALQHFPALSRWQARRTIARASK